MSRKLPPAEYDEYDEYDDEEEQEEFERNMKKRQRQEKRDAGAKWVQERYEDLLKND